LEVVESPTGTRRRRPRGVHQTQHLLFIIVVRRKAFEMPIFGILKDVHCVGRNTILMHLARRNKPHVINLNSLKRRMVGRLPQ